jgi:predicted DNA-binding transcriptional regulator YafY
MELLIVFVLAGAGAALYVAARGRSARTMPPPSAAAPDSTAETLAILRRKAIADLDIEYADADGALTRREVLIVYMELDETPAGENHPTRFTAWCLLRQDRRTFLVPRIQAIFRPGLPPLRTRQEIDQHFRQIVADAQRRADVTADPVKRRRRRH